MVCADDDGGGGGLYGLGLTDGRTVENVVDGTGLVDCDMVVEYADVTGPAEPAEMAGLVAPPPPELEISVYWFLDVVDVDVDVDDGVVDADDEDTANWAVGLYVCG